MGNSEEKIFELVKEFCNKTGLQTPDSITDDFSLSIWVFIASNDSKIRELCDVVVAEIDQYPF